MNIQNTTSGNEYIVGAVVAETSSYRLRLCTQIGTGNECLLQVATESAHNGVLDRLAFILRELAAKAVQLEEEYAPHRKYPDQRLNYHFGFPEVVESFILHEQGERRINVLAFPCLETERTPPLPVQGLVPLSNIVHRDSRRIDIRTSPWILGKALKILDFAHENGVELGGLDLTKILIHPAEHFVIFFDWSDARIHPEGVSAAIQRKEVMELTQGVITLLGGDIATRSFPDEGLPEADPYLQCLLQMAAGAHATAIAAHRQMYRVIREEIGWKGFHHFTTFSR